MAVWANVYLGREQTIGPKFLHILDKRAMLSKTGEMLERFIRNVPPIAEPVEMLSGGQRQVVAIARASAWGSKLILMDEPTAALGVAETKAVEEVIFGLKRQGLTLLVISHNLDQIFAWIFVVKPSRLCSRWSAAISLCDNFVLIDKHGRWRATPSIDNLGQDDAVHGVNRLRTSQTAVTTSPCRRCRKGAECCPAGTRPAGGSMLARCVPLDAPAGPSRNIGAGAWLRRRTHRHGANRATDGILARIEAVREGQAVWRSSKPAAAGATIAPSEGMIVLSVFATTRTALVLWAGEEIRF